MEDCTAKTDTWLMEKLGFDCRKSYTEDEVTELRGIMHEYGTTIAENMCMMILFGVGCECNDFEGNPDVSEG